MNSKLVSIILPVYNMEKYLNDCLESILSQTYLYWELIIVNDGSDDKSDEIIKNFINTNTNQTINYISLSHRGLPSCLNIAIAQANGDYIARIDADDLMKPNRLASQIDFFAQHPHIGVLGSSAVEINEQGDEIGFYNVPTDDINIKKGFFSMCPIIHPSTMIKKNLLLENKYAEVYPMPEDYELWIRLAPKTQFANLAEPLIKKRFHPLQISHTGGKIFISTHLKFMIQYNLRHHRLPPLWLFAKFSIRLLSNERLRYKLRSLQMKLMPNSRK